MIQELNNSTQKSLRRWAIPACSAKQLLHRWSESERSNSHHDSNLCFSKIHQKPHTDWTRNEPICLWTQSYVRMLRCI